MSAKLPERKGLWYCQIENGLLWAMGQTLFNGAESSLIFSTLPFAFSGRNDYEEPPRIDITKPLMLALQRDGANGRKALISLLKRKILWENTKGRYFYNMSVGDWLDRSGRVVLRGEALENYEAMCDREARWKPNIDYSEKRSHNLKREVTQPKEKVTQPKEKVTQPSGIGHTTQANRSHNLTSDPAGPENAPESGPLKQQQITTREKETTDADCIGYARDICLFNSQKDMQLISGFAYDDPHRTMELLHCYAVTKAMAPSKIKVAGAWLRGLWDKGFDPANSHPDVISIRDFLYRRNARLAAQRAEIAEQQKRPKNENISHSDDSSSPESANSPESSPNGSKFDSTTKLSKLFMARSLFEQQKGAQLLRKARKMLHFDNLQSWIESGRRVPADDEHFAFGAALAQAEEALIIHDIAISQEAAEAEKAGNQHSP